MTIATADTGSQQSARTLLVARDDLDFREISILHADPNGSQILAAAGASRDPATVLLQLLPSGQVETVRLDERPALGASNRFLISTSDRIFHFMLDSTRLEWSHRIISGRAVRVIGEVGDDRDLVVDTAVGEVRVLKDDDLLDLGKPGVEVVGTRPKTWRLRVQGVTLEYGEPLVKVADAMRRAGFDPTKAWHIFLIVQGQPKQPVALDYVVDLRTPGIEKIRLMQRNVDNGEVQQAPLARDFALTARFNTRRWRVISHFWRLTRGISMGWAGGGRQSLSTSGGGCWFTTTLCRTASSRRSRCWRSTSPRTTRRRRSTCSISRHGLAGATDTPLTEPRFAP
jgi:hypothetical protein